jgi:hypothetical protein
VLVATAALLIIAIAALGLVWWRRNQAAHS